MGEHQQYKPTTNEFLLTGLFGTFLYFILSLIILFALLKYPKNKFSKYFFISMFLVCLFEIPRFLSIAITKNYQSKLFYIFHLISSIFFFISFTIVCLLWSSLLKLGTYMSSIYSFKGVIISNTIFIIIDIIAMIICGFSSSLHSFFRSIFFEWFIFIDTLKNLLYSTLLLFYGMKLIIKFYRYNTLELTYNLFQSDLNKNDKNIHSNVNNINIVNNNGNNVNNGNNNQTTTTSRLTSQTNISGISGNSNGYRKTAFGIALKKLTIVLFIITICFLIRVMMLIFKLIALQGDTVMSSPSIPLFGFVWFLFSDWIPRCIPSFAFVYLMNIKRHNLKRGGNTDALLKGSYQRTSTTDLENTLSFTNNPDDYDDTYDDLSSLNEQENEYYDEFDDEYLTESYYSDEVKPLPMKPYEWSEGSDENIYDHEEDEQIIFFHQPGTTTTKNNNSNRRSNDDNAIKKSNGKQQQSNSSNSKFSFLNKYRYSWTALSSGFSFNNLINNSNNNSNNNNSNGTTSTSSSSRARANTNVGNQTENSSTSHKKDQDDDISMTSFTSLSQLTSNLRGGGDSSGGNGNGGSGRISPQQKNNGFNNSSPMKIRSVEV